MTDSLLSLTSNISSDRYEMRFQVFGKTYEELLSWEDAREACKLKGGDLASIHSEEENFSIEWPDDIYELEDEHLGAYIGLSTTQDMNAWGWSDKTVTDYANWRNGYL